MWTAWAIAVMVAVMPRPYPAVKYTVENTAYMTYCDATGRQYEVWSNTCVVTVTKGRGKPKIVAAQRR